MGVSIVYFFVKKTFNQSLTENDLASVTMKKAKDWLGFCSPNMSVHLEQEGKFLAL